MFPVSPPVPPDHERSVGLLETNTRQPSAVTSFETQRTKAKDQAHQDAAATDAYRSRDSAARPSAPGRAFATRPPVKVADGVYLGSYFDATSRPGLAAAGVTHIVNATFEFDNVSPDTLSYMRLPVIDRHPERLMPYFPHVVAFANTAIAAGGNVLIHCQHGISRSSTLVIALLMQRQHLRLAEAHAIVRACKSDIEPAPQFLYELRLWEEQLFGDVTSAQKLTVLDKGWSPEPPSPREKIVEQVTVLTSMAAVGICTDNEMHNARARLLVQLHRLDEADIGDALEQMVLTVFMLYPQARPRSAAARAQMPPLLCEVAARRGWSGTHLRTTLEGLFVGEEWEDVCIDLPGAPTLLRELMDGVRNLEVDAP